MGRMPIGFNSKKIECNLSEILELDNNKRFNESCYIHIYDDRKLDNPKDIELLIKKIKRIFPKYRYVDIYDLKYNSYLELLKTKEKINIWKLSLNDYTKKIYYMQPYVSVFADNVCAISPDNYSNVIFDFPYYDSRVMDNKTFIDSVNYIAQQISYYAENDIQKVLLLNKMLVENISYDFSALRSERVKEGYSWGLSHITQTLLVKRKCVCSSIASFATIVLNHPLLNVKTKTLDGICYGGGHTFNEVTINNRKTTCDFTHNITLASKPNIKFLFLKRPSPHHEYFFGFNEYNTVRRYVLLEEYEKIKDIKINMPEIPKHRTIRFVDGSSKKGNKLIKKNDDEY